MTILMPEHYGIPRWWGFNFLKVKVHKWTRISYTISMTQHLFLQGTKTKNLLSPMIFLYIFTSLVTCDLLTSVIDMRKALARDVEKKSMVPIPHPVRPEELDWWRARRTTMETCLGLLWCCWGSVSSLSSSSPHWCICCVLVLNISLPHPVMLTGTCSTLITTVCHTCDHTWDFWWLKINSQPIFMNHSSLFLS